MTELAELNPGDLLAVSLGEHEAALAWADGRTGAIEFDQLSSIETALAPRWVCWSPADLVRLTQLGIRVARCWELSAVHRLLFGGWRADPAVLWAALHDLSDSTLPSSGQLDLLGASGDEGTDLEDPVRPDGHLRPEWLPTGWDRSAERRARWAELALTAAGLQLERLKGLSALGDPLATAHSESVAEQVCAELTVDGLPIDRARAEELIASFIGRRPTDAADAQSLRDKRDRDVLQHVVGDSYDLRSPGSVKAMLARIGIDVPDTRSWRLEHFRGAHPALDALLSWRKAERIATTYGYDWLDRNVGPDDRLRGNWTGSDGAAGRMTASAGLHNLPAELRAAVAAGPDHVFVRADLGQIEPRVLAAVSGDRGLAAASADADLYAPVATRLRVERSVAKIAVLAAMYGQTSGTAGAALKNMESAYPTAMRFLKQAYESGRAGVGVRTYGGRLVRMWPTPAGLEPEAERSAMSSRGRYARNAVIQGAAAELFKVWAVTVRARGRSLDARIVLCLHDELLVRCPTTVAGEVAELVSRCLDEAAYRWAPSGCQVRFVADISTVERWSEAK